MTAIHHDDWTALAKCKGMTDALFPEAADQKRARLFCQGCPVRFQCLAEALDNRIEWGVWGGMTERERRQLLRKHSDIQSWSAFLVDQKRAHAAK
jgi:WhiB family redox-sensing transcriptional regulator